MYLSSSDSHAGRRTVVSNIQERPDATARIISRCEDDIKANAAQPTDVTTHGFFRKLAPQLGPVRTYCSASGTAGRPKRSRLQRCIASDVLISKAKPRTS